MTDVVDRATRSRMMSGIRGRDTKPEIAVRKYLHAQGFRFRIAPGHLPGKPDIVLAKYQAAIFVHGCFWHRHENCRYAAVPATNKAFWQAKFDANVARDRRNTTLLEQAGWRVLVVWECEVKRGQYRTLVNRILSLSDSDPSE